MTVITHKEVDDYAKEYNHDYPLTAVPRSVAAYRPRRHFLDKKRERNISDETVRRCIEEGEPFFAEDDNTYKFHWMNPRTLQTYVLVVKLTSEAFQNDDQKHPAMTVYRFQH